VLFCQTYFAQTNCAGSNIFSASKCFGDEVNADEKELYRIINEYRSQNKLKPIAISEPLSFVANRHLLDLSKNIGKLTHSWSNCDYDIKVERTWNCVFESPTRLNSTYKGKGFENLYRNLNGSATPILALEAWKKSQPHNAMILNLDIWKNTDFDAFGVAIYGDYAAIWFGTQNDKKPTLNKEIKGLGISLARLTNGLTDILEIAKEYSVETGGKWVAKSADNSVQMEIYGQETNITETEMSFSVKIDRKFNLTTENRNALNIFLKNLAPDWGGRETWFDSAFKKIMKNPRSKPNVNVGNKTFEMEISNDGRLVINVKPNKKTYAKEL
jgi:uncharacterized protein YkwD